MVNYLLTGRYINLQCISFPFSYLNVLHKFESLILINIIGITDFIYVFSLDIRFDHLNFNKIVTKYIFAV